ncbi:response regulator [Parapedobacter sp. 10938]|uniref:response regulator n=1 Tax=Parapedobacter flavus TaxID=3110225 RepID=UPI002DBE95CD|nr:hypothetical protein [Parapedobacter sp. 10938]MEC3878627.1 hypothetical protein [Parapedobacter sp. 10938]
MGLRHYDNHHNDNRRLKPQMGAHRCLIIEDDWSAIELMADYVGRRKELTLVGVVQELYEVPDALSATQPDIAFLDLVIPQGSPSDFHFGLIPPTVIVVVVSAIPLALFNRALPPTVVDELPKPVSYEHFNDCIDRIIERLRP